MTHTNSPANQNRPQEGEAAIFIDFENLYLRLHTYLDEKDHPEDIIIEMVEELRRYLRELNHTRTSTIYAYADFGALEHTGEKLKKQLYLAGIEPRFVPEHLQKNASELQLCIDACNLLHNRPQLHSFVVLTGDRFYLPLIQQFKRFGSHTFVAAFSFPPSNRHTPSAEEDLFLDALNLVSDATRSRLSMADYEPETPEERDVEYAEFSSQEAWRTVGIIEQHFGQYDEVYLTPLLRKLSDMLGPHADPKAVVNELEAAGAIWLEKRRGSPYDYTVLLVDYNHPQVEEIQGLYSGTEAHDVADGHPTDEKAPFSHDGQYSEDDYADQQHLHNHEDGQAIEVSVTGPQPSAGQQPGQHYDGHTQHS